MDRRKQETRKKIGRDAATKPAFDPTAPYWLYGVHAVRAALANPKRQKHALFATTNGADALADVMPEGLEVTISKPRQVGHLVGHDAVHQGVALQVSPLVQPRLDQILKKTTESSRLIVLDQVTDPHNVGAIIRSAALFGAGAVVQTFRHGARETAVMVKAASGAFDALPMVGVTNLASALDEMADAGFMRLGLAGEAVETPRTIDKQRPLALVLGAEGRGLREKTRAHCDALLRLPMPGFGLAEGLDSLNVSNAAAVSLYALLPKEAQE